MLKKLIPKPFSVGNTQKHKLGILTNNLAVKGWLGIFYG